MQFHFFSEKSLLIRKNKDLLSFIQKKTKIHLVMERKKKETIKRERQRRDRQTDSQLVKESVSVGTLHVIDGMIIVWIRSWDSTYRFAGKQRLRPIQPSHHPIKGCSIVEGFICFTSPMSEYKNAFI